MPAPYCRIEFHALDDHIDYLKHSNSAMRELSQRLVAWLSVVCMFQPTVQFNIWHLEATESLGVRG